MDNQIIRSKLDKNLFMDDQWEFIQNILDGQYRFVGHVKSETEYYVNNIAINTTNENENQIMVCYECSDTDDLFVREIREFFEKFDINIDQ